jgi:curved DNA-binding protein CbpA
MAARGGRQDHYEVLAVSCDAPDEVIRAAYRALAAKYHPDKNPTDRDADLKLKRLNAAFAVLGDPKRRKQYDELTRGPEANDAQSEEEPKEPAGQRPRGKVPGGNEREGSHRTGSDWPAAARQVSGRAAGPLRSAMRWLSAFAIVFAVALLLIASVSAVEDACDHNPAYVNADTLANQQRQLANSTLYDNEINSVLGAQAPATAKTTTPPAIATAPPSQPGYASGQWFEQPDYRVAFPGVPQPTERNSVATRSGMAKVTITTLSRPSGALYAVQETDYPRGTPLSERGAIDGAIKRGSAAKGDHLTLASDQQATIGTCNGRDFAAIGSTFVVRGLVCVEDSKTYIATSVVPKSASDADAADALSFLGSFSITMAPVLRQLGAP